MYFSAFSADAEGEEFGISGLHSFY